MALTQSQVNAAYIAVLGRAAEGNGFNWASNFASTKDVAKALLTFNEAYTNASDNTTSLSNDAYVNYMYQTVLGHAADDAGRASFLNLIQTVGREAATKSFFDAVNAAVAAGNETLATGFQAANEAFVESLYSKLLNRGADSAGLDATVKMLNAGATKAEVVEALINAINANPNSDDYKTFTNKMTVANKVTDSLASLKAGLNSTQKESALQALRDLNDSVNSATDTASETITNEITTVVGNYQTEANKNFTTGADTFNEAQAKNAVVFQGSVNLADSQKSTIATGDTVTGSQYSDTLIVNVVSGTQESQKNFNLANLGASVSSVENLTINNGSANVTLTTGSYNQNVKITGTGNATVSVNNGVEYLEVNTGVRASGDISVSSALSEYKGGNGVDKITVTTSGSLKTVNTGTGNDIVTVSGGSISGATINLGAGDDTVTLSSGTVAGATIDGGVGTDTLKLAVDAKGVTFTNFEIIETTGSDAEVKYSQIKNGITLKASSNALKVDATSETTINLNDLKAGTTPGSDKIVLNSVGENAKVSLDKANAITETITLASGASKVSITNFDKTGTAGTDADKIDMKTTFNSSLDVDNSKQYDSDSNKINTLTANKLYYVDGAIKVDNNGKVDAAILAAITTATLSSGSDIYVASVAQNETKIYKLTSADTSLDNKGSVELIATVDAALAFDGGSIA